MSWIKQTLKTVRDTSIDKNKLKQFAGIVIAFLLFLFCLSVYKKGLLFHQKQILIASVIGILTILLFLVPLIFSPFLFVWLFVGNILGEISSFIILGIIYYLFFTPISLIIRLKKKKKTIKGWIDKKETIDYKKLY